MAQISPPPKFLYVPPTYPVRIKFGKWMSRKNCKVIEFREVRLVKAVPYFRGVKEFLPVFTTLCIRCW